MNEKHTKQQSVSSFRSNCLSSMYAYVQEKGDFCEEARGLSSRQLKWNIDEAPGWVEKQ